MTREKTYRITRIEKDKSRILVGFTPDLCEIGVMIDEDRDKYDCEEDRYEVTEMDAGEGDNDQGGMAQGAS